MVRLVVFLVGIAVAATGLSWLADRPGSLVVNWQGHEIETSVFRAVVMLAILVGLSIFLWSLITALWRSPASVGAFFNRRRQMRGLEALSGGMIAIGAGDRANATRYAVAARKALPNEPLTQLLRAQAAQLTGDRTTARRMYEAMLSQPETEQLGLRGLFLEAEREGEREAARQFAERSVELNPKLGWAVDALFDLQCKDRDWAGALETLSVARQHQHHDKPALDRRRAVLMTARAQALEEGDPNRAMGLAIEAHHLAHDLVPAAALAGRMLAARGHTKRAAKIIERAWRRAPHPDLALVYAHARIGDSPRDRLDRIKRLAQLNPHSLETPIAIATAAIEARDWATARRSLELLDPSRMTQRVCMLMARIEGEEHADKGRSREWLARAVHAPRDPAWVADGVVSDKWAPVSPRTGAFDVFEWRVPADALDVADNEVLAAKLDELVKLTAPVVVSRPAAGTLPAEAGVRGAEDIDVAAAVRREPGHPHDNRPEPLQRDHRAVETHRELDDTSTSAVSQRSLPTPRSVRVATDAIRSPAAGGRQGSMGSVEVLTGPASGSRREEAQPPSARSRTEEATSREATGRPASAVAHVSVVPPAQRAETRALEPGMFIAPRAPDDPGVEALGGTEPTKPVVRAITSGKR